MWRSATCWRLAGCGALLALTLMLPGAVFAQGIALSGVGPVNRAMGGAATAAPIDASGALYTNPASISGLDCSQMDIGLELLLPTENLSSSVFVPQRTIAGSTGGEPGVTPIPTMALVHKCQDSPWTLGLGMFGIAGFRSNYPASTTNPVLLPQPHLPGQFGGMGRVNSQAQFFQIVPTASYAITDKLSVGFAPTVTAATFSLDPLCLVPPDADEGRGALRYPSGCGTRTNWGGGFQVGAYYITDSAWHWGFTFKSPQWFEPIRINTEDELGLPRRRVIRFDYPMIVSLGTAYSGIENWLFACDVRYFDYAHAAGFGDPAGFAPDGRVTGLGWKSIVSVHLGAQYQATERWYVRLGYRVQRQPHRQRRVVLQRRFAADHPAHSLDRAFVLPDGQPDSFAGLSARLREPGHRPDGIARHRPAARHFGHQQRIRRCRGRRSYPAVLSAIAQPRKTSSACSSSSAGNGHHVLRRELLADLHEAVLVLQKGADDVGIEVTSRSRRG